MQNGYFLADANSLSFAYRAGGTQLLDDYLKAAKRQDREFAITKTVAKEIEKGPQGQELGRYLADRAIPILSTPNVEQQLKTGKISSKNAGDVSMVEIAASEHAAGRTTRVWSDDKFFDSQQILSKNPGVQPVQTSQLLDDMRQQDVFTDTEYRRARASYQQTVSTFQPDSPSYSPRLNDFEGPAPRFVDHLGVADARIAVTPEFQTVAKGAGVVGAGLMVYDAVDTERKYAALSAQGNQFGADALLHDYVGRTGGGLIGGFAAGAAYGAATGSWTGPGALVTGAVGGAIGAFGGEAIAKAYTQYEMNHQVGNDGHTYAYANGKWETSNWIHQNQPAPQDQIATLEYKRVSAVTELALANPQHLDTQNITLTDAHGQKTEYSHTKNGWVTQVIDSVQVPNDLGIIGTHNEPAPPELGKQLDRISAARHDANEHYAENLAKAYMTDYVGRGFARDDRPVPEAVTNALHLPSEIHVKDPVTGNVWERNPKGEFTRTQYASVPGPEGPVFVSQVLTAKGPELERLGQEQHAHVQSNRKYGAGLVAQKFQEMQQQSQQQHQPAGQERASAHPAPTTDHAGPAPQPQHASPAAKHNESGAHPEHNTHNVQDVHRAHNVANVNNASNASNAQHDPRLAEIAALKAEIAHHMQVAELKDQIAKLEAHLSQPDQPTLHGGPSLHPQAQAAAHPAQVTPGADASRGYQAVDHNVPQHAAQALPQQHAQVQQPPAPGRSR